MQSRPRASKQNTNLIKLDLLPLPNRGKCTKSSDLANSNAAFLGALHASVDDGQQSSAGGGGKQQSVVSDGSFIMDATPNIHLKHNNKVTTPQSSDVDAAFLLDVHRGESYSTQGSSSGFTTNNYSSSSQDSGTFVFKGPSSTKVDQSTSTSTQE